MSATLLFLFAGLMGAAGIVLAAMGAHTAPGAGLDSAGNMLLFHAAAVCAIAVGVQTGIVWRPLALAAAFGLVLGAALFSGDLALRALAGTRLFPRAAPTGGVVLIAGWVLLAAAALARLIRGA